MEYMPRQITLTDDGCLCSTRILQGIKTCKGCLYFTRISLYAQTNNPHRRWMSLFHSHFAMNKNLQGMSLLYSYFVACPDK